MQLKALHWNIGGGLVRDDLADPTKDSSYAINELAHIIEVIAREQPDIVTLAEAHVGGGSAQAETISHACGFTAWCNFAVSPSHLRPGMFLSNAILARFPMSQQETCFFLNPKVQTTWSDGTVATSHDKGRVRAIVTMPDGTHVQVTATHLLPFWRFKVDPFSHALFDLRLDMGDKLKTHAPRALIQGDFNFDSPALAELLPSVVKDEMKEIAQYEPTTPQGMRLDHVLYRGMRLKSSKVIMGVRTDHYPIISVFEV